MWARLRRRVHNWTWQNNCEASSLPLAGRSRRTKETTLICSNDEARGRPHAHRITVATDAPGRTTALLASDKTRYASAATVINGLSQTVFDVASSTPADKTRPASARPRDGGSYAHMV